MDPLDRLAGLRAKEERLALGLMSGMSGDGLDLALLRLRGTGERPTVELVSSRTVAYAADTRTRLRAAIGGSARDAMLLSFELAGRWADDVLAFLESLGVPPGAVDVLGSHGQTLDHLSARRAGRGATLQVGDGDLLAERTGILVVSDFRPRDVALGGEGAPLVPVADWILYATPGRVVAANNLGSISNVTVVTERLEDVSAFDTGPANALVDAFARLVEGNREGIDADGRISARGRVVPAVLETLRASCGAYLAGPPPKSAGYDDFGPALAARTRDAHAGVAPEDLVATAVRFTAETLVDAYVRFVLPRFPSLDRVILTGGGAWNRTLVGLLEADLGTHGLDVEVPPRPWVEAKEAAAFALLADRTARGLPGNAPGATGARRAAVLGKLSLP